MKIEPEYQPDIKNRNYIFKKDSRWYVHIGKKIKHHARIDYNNELGFDLSKVIDDSLLNFPRNNLIEMDYKTMHKKYFMKLGINHSMIRKAYKSWYSDAFPDASYNDKKWLADLMRHSLSTAEIYYRKKVSKVDDGKTIDSKLKELKTMVDESKRNKLEKIAKYTDDIKREKARVASKKYYDGNKLKAKIIKYVSHLNLPDGSKYKIKTPSETKAIEYRLYTDDDGKWGSDVIDD
jgi:hypothetical protein